MRVFDVVERDDMSPYNHGESLWMFLNRSGLSAAETARDFIESLLSEYPAQEKDELVARLRSEEFEGAYFELLLHALLIRHGAHVRIHSIESSGNSRRADFLATFPGGQTAILEAVVSKDMSASEEAAEAGWSQLFHAIDQIPSRFYIGMEFPTTRAPKRPPATRRVLAFLKRKLARLDDLEDQGLLEGDSVRDKKTLLTSIFRDGDITIEFAFLPRNHTQQGIGGSIGIYPSKSRWGGSSRAIKTAVEGKASKYGDLKHPYIVVVNSLSNWIVTTGDEIEALFGGPEADHGGALIRRDGTSRNTQVSGVVIGSVLWRPGSARLRLYENPHARRPCSALPWRLDRVHRDGSASVLESGESMGQILGLPTEWPGDFSS